MTWADGPVQNGPGESQGSRAQGLSITGRYAAEATLTRQPVLDAAYLAGGRWNGADADVG